MDPTPEEITALADQLSLLAKRAAASTDPAERRGQTQALVLQAKKLISKVQDPFDALMDHTINAYTIAATLALMEIGVFEAIPPPPATIGIKELAEKCTADESLIIRLMRQLTCVNIFDEVRVWEWSHNRLSIGLSQHVGMTGKYFFEVCMDEMMPSILRLNRYLREFGKGDITSYTHTPHSWQDDKLGQNFWQVLGSSPDRIQRFSRGLSLFATLHPVVAMFPFATALQPNNSASRVLAVDIGGGRGLAMLELRRRCPSLQGALVLQDRAEVLADVADADLPGVRKMAHDFFTEQPVRGAQVYYIRRVLHDWQDADVVRILRAVVPAMARDSRILVSDMAMPEPVAPVDAGAVWLDLMMLSIGGRERTARDWEALAVQSGLRLVKVWQEKERFGPLCVVEYVLKEDDDVKEGGGEKVKEVEKEEETEKIDELSGIQAEAMAATDTDGFLTQGDAAGAGVGTGTGAEAEAVTKGVEKMGIVVS